MEYSRIEADAIYKSQVEMLPVYGWPKWGPSIEVPRQTMWWNKEIEIMPDPANIQKSVYPNLRIIDFFGLPKSGKSTLLEKLRKSIIGNAQHIGYEVIIYDECYKSLDGEAKDYFMTTYYFLGDLDQEIWDEVPPLQLEKDWISMLELHCQKEHCINVRLQELYRRATTGKRILAVFYRGPIDSLIWMYAQVAHKGDARFEIPEWYRSEIVSYSPIVVGLSAYARNIRSTVVMGLSREEAKRRRSHLSYPGWVVDSPMFDDLSAWYGHYVENIAPKNLEFHGTGLLVLNGEKSLKHSAETINDHVKAVMMQ